MRLSSTRFPPKSQSSLIPRAAQLRRAISGCRDGEEPAGGKKRAERTLAGHEKTIASFAVSGYESHVFFMRRADVRIPSLIGGHMFWTTVAYAMAPSPGGEAQTWSTLGSFALILAVFYFLLIRPQQKRAKEQKAMLEALRKGDEVITSGGIYGRIVETQEKCLIIDLGETQVKILRSAVTSVPTAASPAPREKERKGRKEARKAGSSDEDTRARDAESDTENGKDRSR
jgi:preprotein translocase subunit YajC